MKPKPVRQQIQSLLWGQCRLTKVISNAVGEAISKVCTRLSHLSVSQRNNEKESKFRHPDSLIHYPWTEQQSSATAHSNRAPPDRKLTALKWIN